jgi:serine protease Do
MAVNIAGGPALAAISEELAAAAERASASVVQVRAGRGGIGSGVIWPDTPGTPGAAEAGVPSTDGAAPAVTIVTNEHVVRAAGDGRLSVLLDAGRELPAEVVAHDPEHDLALLRVRAAGLRPVAVGDSQALRVGEFIFAVGNPFGRINTLTAGIVAARAPVDPDWTLAPARPDGGAEGDAPAPPPARDERQDERQGERPSERDGERDEDSPRRRAARTPDLIQSNLRLYPGNSGGPLLNARGEVVGINNMIGGGLAFAIPSRIVRQFVAAADADAPSRPRLGVQVLDVELPTAMRLRAGTNAPSAVLIAAVEADSPAAASGLLPGDLVIGIDGRAVASVRDLLLALGQADPGARTLTLLRGGVRRELALPPGQAAAAAA